MSVLTDKSARSAHRDEQVMRYLTRQLSLIRQGQALPSVRQVMRDCNVSQLIVQRSLDVLKDQGLVVSVPGRGLFKGRSDNPAAEAIKTIDVLRIIQDSKNWMERPDFTGELIRAIGERCARRSQSIRTIQIDPKDVQHQLNDVLRRNDIKACILFQSPRNDLIESVFDPMFIPAVHLLPRTQVLPPHSIVVDAAQATRLQLEHLWSLGHEQIGLLHRFDPKQYNRAFSLQYETYHDLMAQHGVRVVPSWVQYAESGSTAEVVVKGVQAMLNGPKPPTAIIAPDQFLPAIYQTLALQGLRVGGNFSVIGTDDLAMTALLHPPGTTVCVRRGTLAAAALDMLDRRIAGEAENEVVSLSAELVVRQSTCPPAPR